MHSNCHERARHGRPCRNKTVATHLVFVQFRTELHMPLRLNQVLVEALTLHDTMALDETSLLVFFYQQKHVLDQIRIRIKTE